MTYTVDAVQEALGVLKVVAQSPGLGLSEIGRRSGITKARTYRFLCTFEESGFVRRAPNSANYILGPAAVLLGLQAQEQSGIERLAERHLEALVAKFNETAGVLVRDGIESVLIARHESDHGVQVKGAIGRRRPLHAGASGKVLLAFGPAHVLDRILEGDLTKIAVNTITSKAKLKQELKKIREQGFAMSVSEGVADVVAVAAPVFDSTGLIQATLGISMPASRAPANPSELVRAVIAAAEQLSFDLGWHKGLTPGL